MEEDAFRLSDEKRTKLARYLIDLVTQLRTLRTAPPLWLKWIGDIRLYFIYRAIDCDYEHSSMVRDEMLQFKELAALSGDTFDSGFFEALAMIVEVEHELPPDTTIPSVKRMSFSNSLLGTLKELDML